MPKAVKKIAFFRFYAELNDFLPFGQRFKRCRYHFWGTPSINNAIQAQGIPHTEVDLILVHGTNMDLSYRLKSGDHVSVYPFFKSLGIGSIGLLHPEPIDELKFIIDANLGKLARYVRMLGFDSLYDNQFSDLEIIRISDDENRIVLTRDLEILKQSKVKRGYFLRSTQPGQQLVELVNRYDLLSGIQPFTRCMDCNGRLYQISKELIQNEVPADTYQIFKDFFQCSRCSKIYWKGSHYEKMFKLVEGLKNRK